MKNSDLVKYFYQLMINLEVSEIVVCAGARNAPLVVGLESQAFKIKSYFEERSAAFYAMGRIAATKKPVAIITTSGTAVAELLPAVIESYYQGLPLILITADRPKSYRGSGSPQSIEQANIFSSYASAYDWDVNTTDFKVQYDAHKPIHFNLCFDEPLIDGGESLAWDFNLPIDVDRILDFTTVLQNKSYATDFSQFNKAFVILGQLPEIEIEQVKKHLLQYQVYHYAEALSGLLGDRDLQHLQLNNFESLIGELIKKSIFTSVVRIGGVPTLRFWRDLESKYKSLPVLNIVHLNFSGLARPSAMADYSVVGDVMAGMLFVDRDLVTLNRELQMQKREILLQHKSSEQTLLFGLNQVIQQQPVYIGNSLPIREWDLFTHEKQSKVYANRGANGIDGQISSYLGWSAQLDISWAVIGDLTALYDLAALGLNADEKFKTAKRLVVVNNRGGQIFKKVFNHEKFLNTHELDFSHWAKMWGWDYIAISHYTDLQKIMPLAGDKTLRNYVIELRTDQQESDLVWQKWDQVCKNIML